VWHHRRVAHSAFHLRRTGTWLWTLGIVLLYALHFVHLSADFPADHEWKDAAVVTDEGWYLNGATRHTITGHWYVSGDFNPAVAQPVWPFLAAMLFHFTGSSIVAARALAVALLGIALVCTALLVRRHSPRWVALLVLSFAVASPFLFAFSRLALPESLLLCLLSLALLLADLAAPTLTPARRWLLAGTLGALLLFMALTKLSALSFYPAILYLLWHRLRRSPRQAVASLACVAAIVVVGYDLYRGMVLMPRYQADLRYFYAANDFGSLSSLKGLLISLRFGVNDLWATCGWLAVLACVVVLASLSRPYRGLRSEPLFVAAILVVLGTWAFVSARGYHAPRYYLFIPIPLPILVALGLRAALERESPRYSALLVALTVGMVLVFTGRTVALVRRPSYTFLNAAGSIKQIIDRDPSARRLLLAESGDQITLMTRQLSICDNFGTVPLSDEIRQQDPGWFATWDGVIPATLAELHTRYHLQRVAAFPVSGDPGRSALLLYRLVPLSQSETGVLLHTTPLKMYRRPAA
jgi:hypothetical protein